MVVGGRHTTLCCGVGFAKLANARSLPSSVWAICWMGEGAWRMNWYGVDGWSWGVFMWVANVVVVL